MSTNFYFNNHAHSGQQELIENLIIESIKIYGYEVYYLRRTLVAEDDLFGEDKLSKFDNATMIEMYLKNVEGFEGEGEFLSKFNIEVRDQITFSVSVNRFVDEITIGTTHQDEDANDVLRPVEGDLIYFPLTGGLYEIKYVVKEPIFYQMGGLQMYDLQCELFEYSHEIIDTGIVDIDAIAERRTVNILNFKTILEAFRAVAQGTATISGQQVTQIELTEGGDYDNTPTIIISDPPASQVAIVSATLNTTGDTTSVGSTTIISAGTAYQSNGTATFSDPTATPATATATATITAGSVTSTTISANGTHYLTTPTISVQTAPEGGTTAVITASIANNGVSALTISNAGSGYVTAPILTISAPTGIANNFTANGIAVATGGVISSITITDSGKYYLGAPTVTISNPPDAITASANATLTGSTVTAITIANNGFGYTTTPSVTFSSESLVGNLLLEDGSNLIQDDGGQGNNNPDPISNNAFFETQKNELNFIDFSETNPFSEGEEW